MSEPTYDNASDDISRDDEVLDLDTAFGDDRTDEVIDTSYSPPDHEPTATKFGTTWQEEHDGETLEQRLAQEVPDPSAQVDDENADDPDAVDENVLEEGDLVYSEVGGERAGRLVDPDEGAHEDAEKDLVGSDVGIDAGAASAEEAAMHVIEE